MVLFVVDLRYYFQQQMRWRSLDTKARRRKARQRPEDANRTDQPLHFAAVIAASLLLIVLPRRAKSM